MLQGHFRQIVLCTKSKLNKRKIKNAASTQIIWTCRGETDETAKGDDSVGTEGGAEGGGRWQEDQGQRHDRHHRLPAKSAGQIAANKRGHREGVKIGLQD